MTERDFEHILDFAQDWLHDFVRQEYKSSDMRVVFFSGPGETIELRWTRQCPKT